MSLEGFLYLHRKLAEWEWYDDANTMRLFIHCLIFANFKEKQWRGITIKRGQFITSQPKLAQGLKLSVRQIRTSLDKLKMTGELTVYTTADYSIITINNYDIYQPNDRLTNSLMTDKRQANDRLMTTTNNDNNDNNENNDKNNIGVEKKISNPDFYFSSDKTKVFEIYENECKNLIPLTGEKRNRKVLDKTSNFLNEIEFDWDYFKNLCQKANELKTIANTKIDFEMLINCHIGIMNGKYHKDENKRGVSQEFIDNFFENLKKEEAQNE